MSEYLSDLMVMTREAQSTFEELLKAQAIEFKLSDNGGKYVYYEFNSEFDYRTASALKLTALVNSEKIH